MTSYRYWLATNIACLIVAAGTNAIAADYYFDSVAGDDSKDGQTEATAKKTLKMPTGSGHTVHLKRGSSWTLNLSANNVTVTTFGSGERPSIIGTLSVTKSTVEGVAVRPPAGGTKAVNCINVMGDSTLRDCEADGGGSADNMINVGIGVMGQNNRILGNYVHDLAWSQSGGQMDNSGGAEGIMVMASNNEVAYNSAVRCSSKNSTLGGFEGGCFEIVNGKAGSTISNVSFHHNYCEQSIGMWEGCSGDFSASGGGIQENHGIIENVTISYNLSVDSMWLFLLQPVNTDFKNVVFANNAIIHTAKSKEYWDNSSFHYSMANAVATYTNSSTNTTYETDNAYYKKSGGFQPGTIIVKNNIFMDDVGTTRYQMFLTNLTDHSNNLFLPSNASLGSITLGTTEKKLNVADLALTADFRLTAASTPAIDTGVSVGMTGNGSLATSALDPAFFPEVFTKDYDKHPVPCGSGVDIGPFEYCEGAAGAPSAGGATSVAKGGTSGVSNGGSRATSTASAVAAGGTATVSATGATEPAKSGANAGGRAGTSTTSSSIASPSGGSITVASSSTKAGTGSTGSSTAAANTGGATSPPSSSASEPNRGEATAMGGNSAATSTAAVTAGPSVGEGGDDGCNCRMGAQQPSRRMSALWLLGFAALAMRRCRRQAGSTCR
jgi:MYXO-CTERM domain-containing protein